MNNTIWIIIIAIILIATQINYNSKQCDEIDNEKWEIKQETQIPGEWQSNQREFEEMTIKQNIEDLENEIFNGNIQIPDFPEDITSNLKEKLGGEIDYLYIEKLITYNNEGNASPRETKGKGISIRNIKKQLAYKTYSELYDDFDKKGYQIFLTNHDTSEDTYDVAVIKKQHKYENIKLIQTEAINYDLTNMMIIEKIENLSTISDFRIRVIDNDYIEAEIIKMPENIYQMAAYIYELAPDTIFQGAGSFDNLVEYIQKNNNFWLRWD